MFVKLKPVDAERELSVVLQAMRKIREGLVASARVDDFARRVYVFIVRATILTKHMESYHPRVTSPPVSHTSHECASDIGVAAQCQRFAIWTTLQLPSAKRRVVPTPRLRLTAMNGLKNQIQSGQGISPCIHQINTGSATLS